MSTSNKEIIQANDLITQAKEITIATHGDAAYAAEFLSRANKALDLLKVKEDERTKRIKEELEFIKAPYAEPKKQLNAIIATLRGKLSTYQTQGLDNVQVLGEKIGEKVLAGKMTLAKGSQKLQEVTPDAKIGVPSGSLSFRPKQTLEIISFEAIPRNYLVPDEEMILKDMKAGIKIDGCVLRTIQVPINRRN